MAAGDEYITCDNNEIGNDALLRLMIVKDAEGNPAFRTYNPDAGGGGSVFPSPVQRTPSIERVTDAGIIAAGAKSVSIANTGTTDGTVNTITLKAGESISFSAGMYDTLSAIDYDCTANLNCEFLITKVS